MGALPPGGGSSGAPPAAAPRGPSRTTFTEEPEEDYGTEEYQPPAPPQRRRTDDAFESARAERLQQWQDPSSDYHDLDRDNGPPRGRVNMRGFQDPSSDYHDQDRDNGAPRGRVNMRDFQEPPPDYQDRNRAAAPRYGEDQRDDQGAGPSDDRYLDVDGVTFERFYGRDPPAREDPQHPSATSRARRVAEALDAADGTLDGTYNGRDIYVVHRPKGASSAPTSYTGASGPPRPDDVPLPTYIGEEPDDRAAARRPSDSYIPYSVPGREASRTERSVAASGGGYSRGPAAASTVGRAPGLYPYEGPTYAIGSDPATFGRRSSVSTYRPIEASQLSRTTDKPYIPYQPPARAPASASRAPNYYQTYGSLQLARERLGPTTSATSRPVYPSYAFT